MEPVKAGSAGLYAQSAVKPRPPVDKPASADLLNSVTKVEQSKVSLSEEGKALLSALKEIENDNQPIDKKDKSVGDKVESFTYGALGMEHPDKIEEEKDNSYSAGQYFSGAATIGAILLAIV
jgi:hypothetical protein